LALRPLIARARRFPFEPDVPPVEELRRIEGQYDLILREFRENHEPHDWERFKLRHPDVFKAPRLGKAWLMIRIWVRHYLRYVLIIVLPPALVWGAIW
jgi:hypothetical protein